MIEASKFLGDMAQLLERYGDEIPSTITVIAHSFPEEEMVKLMLVKDSKCTMHRQTAGTLVFDYKLNNGGKMTLFGKGGE